MLLSTKGEVTLNRRENQGGTSNSDSTKAHYLHEHQRERGEGETERDREREGGGGERERERERLRMNKCKLPKLRLKFQEKQPKSSGREVSQKLSTAHHNNSRNSADSASLAHQC